MKNILRQYPSLYHQLLLLFLVEHICFSLVLSSSDNYNSGDTLGIGASLMEYYSIVISLIYLLAGWAVDKLQNFRKGLQIGIGLLSFGWFIGLIGGDFGFLGLTIFSYLGHCIFYLFCLIHVSLFFPVANDWKDFAFFLLLLLPQLITPIFTNIFISIFQSGHVSVDNIFMATVTAVSLGGLYYFFKTFNNLGYKIEEENESLPINDEEEESSIKGIMTGIVLVGVLLSFIGSKLGELEIEIMREAGSLLDDFIGDMIGYNSFYFVKIIVLVSFFIFGIFYMSNFSSRQSKQILKIDRSILFLFALVILNLLSLLGGNFTTDYFLDMCFLFVYILLILPMLLSILTHVNLDENLGLWLAALIGLPTLAGTIINRYIVPSSLYHLLPFAALGLLILLRIWLRENKILLKEKLDLDTPNRIEGENDNLDIIDHLLEK